MTTNDETPTGPELWRCGVPVNAEKLRRMLADEPEGTTVTIQPGRAPQIVVRGPVPATLDTVAPARQTEAVDDPQGRVQ